MVSYVLIPDIRLQILISFCRAARACSGERLPAEMGTQVRILVTGNLGYVGSVLVPHFRDCFPDASIVGYDTGYFAHCLTSLEPVPELALSEQHYGDIREIPDSVIEGADAIVHLAAISNDPIGNRYEEATAAINYGATERLGRRALEFGVKAFVFASSCSIYGFAEGGPRTEDDELNPLTAYAKSKIASEHALASLGNSGMTITALRFATACGMSKRLRLDLVLNDFVAGALSTGEITILSDGTPWRPLIDVSDMARAIQWAIERPPDVGGRFLALNIGREDWNYQVRDLAQAVALEIPDTRVSVNTRAPADRRSYRVSFEKFRKLAPAHQPKKTLVDSVHGLHHGLKNFGFGDPNFREGRFMRLKVIEAQREAGVLDSDLRRKRHER